MKETAIAYILTNRVLLEEIFFNWKNFSEKLNKGPHVMREELFNFWNIAKDKLKEKVDLNIVDLKKNVNSNDFDITANATKNNIRIFYFIFPDADIAMAQCKCVALALTLNMPRYFTMEYLSKNSDGESFVFGEWVMNIDSKNFIHNNYGKLSNPTIENFAKRVLDILEQ